MRNYRALGILVIATNVAISSGCGIFKKKSSDDDATVDTSSATTNYPTNLALSSPTTAVAGKTSLFEEPVRLAILGDTATESTTDKSPADKIAENKAMIAGADGCEPRLAGLKIEAPTCFAQGFTVTGATTTNSSNPYVTVPTTLTNIDASNRGIRGGDGGIQAETFNSEA